MEREKEKEKEKEKEEIEGRGEICHEPFQACNGAPFNWKEGRKKGGRCGKEEGNLPSEDDHQEPDSERRRREKPVRRLVMRTLTVILSTAKY